VAPIGDKMNKHLFLSQCKGFKTDRSHFLELYGSLEVMNNYLKIAVLCLSLVCVGLIVLISGTALPSASMDSSLWELIRKVVLHVLASESVEFHPRNAN